MLTRCKNNDETTHHRLVYFTYLSQDSKKEYRAHKNADRERETKVRDLLKEERWRRLITAVAEKSASLSLHNRNGPVLVCHTKSTVTERRHNWWIRLVLWDKNRTTSLYLPEDRCMNFEVSGPAETASTNCCIRRDYQIYVGYKISFIKSIQ